MIHRDKENRRRRRSRAWLVAGLLACVLPAFASTTAEADTRPDVAAFKARDAARVGFQKDLVSVLAVGGNSRSLLGAALLARPLFNPKPELSFHRLLERAIALDPDDPALHWAALADCDEKAADCPNADALAALERLAPDNAAVWLVQLGVDARERRKKAAREDLARAAGAKFYDDYTGRSLQALAYASAALPTPEALLDPAEAGAVPGFQTLLTFTLGNAQPAPMLPLAGTLCEKSATDPALKADCLALAKILAWGSSPLARSLGLHLTETLAEDPDQRREAATERSDLVWQVRQFNRLLNTARGDPALARELLALARHGGTEMSLKLAALRGRNIPLEAPVQPPATPQPAATTETGNTGP